MQLPQPPAHSQTLARRAPAASPCPQLWLGKLLELEPPICIWEALNLNCSQPGTVPLEPPDCQQGLGAEGCWESKAVESREGK